MQAEPESLTIDEMRAALRAEGFRVSRDQFRRWQHAGILEPPIMKRRGRGRAAGWEVARFPRTVLERLRIIARVSGLRTDRISVFRIPLGHSAWAVWRAGYAVPERVLRTALVRAATPFDNARSRSGESNSALVEDAINRPSTRISNPLLREVRKSVNKRGRDPINRYDKLAVLIAKLAEGEIVQQLPTERKTLDVLLPDRARRDSAFRSFASISAGVSFVEVAEKIPLDLLNVAAKGIEHLPEILSGQGPQPQLVATLSKYATQLDIESQMLLALIIVAPLLPELIHAAEVSRNNQ